MGRRGLLLILVTIAAFTFCGCKKNMVQEVYTPITSPVIPDFTTQVQASVHGFITNESGEAVPDASITAGAVIVTTNEFGYFSIRNTAFAKSAAFITVKKEGYFTGFRSFLPSEGKETFIRLKLIPKTTSGIIGSVAGGTVSITGGASITLPANAVMKAASQALYTGEITVSAHWLDPADMPSTSLIMPGDLSGVDSAGHLNVLQTFGMMAVELSANGEPLQIIPGQKARLHFPIPAALQNTAPAYIPLWYFDEAKGIWQQEGHASKNGNSYEGEVNHFTFWNCDIGLPLVSFTAQLTDAALNPLLNVPVSITPLNMPNMTRLSYTDANGMVNGLVPANSTLAVDIMTPCNENLPARTITTVNQPIDLGTVAIDLGQYAARISGTVTNCSNNPVSNGYVIITGLGSNGIINLDNGVFTAAGIICNGAERNVIAYDRETSQQSEPLAVTLAQGDNIIGELHACAAATTEVIHVSYDAVTLNYTLPQYIFGGNFYFLNDSTSINAIDLLNGSQQVFQFSFAGTATPGVHALANNRVAYIDNRNWTFDSGTTVNLTSYGLIGQFITGTLNGNATSSTAPPVTKTFSIEFSIVRDQ